MARLLSRPQKAMAAAVAIVIVLTFLPARWLGWTADISGLVSFPMAPFQDMGKAAATRLRPEERTAATDSEHRLLEEKERFERLYRAEQARVAELESHLEQLQGVPIEKRPSVTAILANLIGSSPRSLDATVQINRGAHDGVEPHTIAVYGGVHLVGRVVEGVSARQSRVEPITSTAEPIRARVLPRDASEMRMDEAPIAILHARRDGTFRAENLARDVRVRPGDVVRLDDHHWPVSAQAMLLGEVESIAPNDRDALRSIIVIRPRYHVRNLRTITLYLERPQEHAAAGAPAGERGGER